MFSRNFRRKMDYGNEENEIPTTDLIEENSNNESITRTPKRGIEQVSVENDSQLETATKIARFELSEETEKWTLDPELAKYANKYIDTFITNQSLKENILVENPVPANVHGCKKLDSFVREMLVEQNKTICMSQEKSLANLQQRIENIYEPLSKVWSAIEMEKVNVDNENEEDLIFTMSSLFDQTILLLGQAVNSCAYIRRFNILMSFMTDKKKVEGILKENAAVFAESDDNLFGEKYEETMIKSAKSKKKTKEFFGSMKGLRPSSSTSTNRQPFPRSSLPQTRGGGRGRNFFYTAGQTLQQQNFNSNRTRGRLFAVKFPNRFSKGEPSFPQRVLQNTSSSKKNIYNRDTSIYSYGRKAKALSSQLEKANKRFSNFEHGKRLRDTFGTVSKTIKSFFPTKNGEGREDSNKRGGSLNVRKGCNLSSRAPARTVLEPNLFGKKEG